MKYTELMCVGCHYRWYAQLSKYSQLRRIICPKCKVEGLIIATGEEPIKTRG